MPPKNDDTFKMYMQEVLKTKNTPLSRFNLPIPKKMESFADLVAEGNKILEAEENAKSSKKIIAKVHCTDQTKELESKLASQSSNPYVSARSQILNEMAPEKRSVILKMETGSLEKDSRYEEFCKDIRKLGDKMSANN